MSSTVASKADGEDTPRSGPGLLRRVMRFLTQPPRKKVDESLAIIRDGLGIERHQDPDPANPESPAPGATFQHAPTEIEVVPTETMARPIFYAPDMDGQADPGEVVWIWVPADGPTLPAKERAMVVVGRSRSSILGLLISCNPEHRGDEDWLDIGSGGWDQRGRQSWVRLDRVLEVGELGIRRQGTVVPRGRFERIANRMRTDFGWT